MPLVALFLVLFGLFACDEIDPVVSEEPQISLFLLNRDSLDQIQPILDALEIDLKNQDSVISDLETAESGWFVQLEQYNDSVDVQGRTDLEAKRQEAQYVWDSLSMLLQVEEYEDSVVNAAYKTWSATKRTIEDGTVNISKVENATTLEFIEFDSSDSLDLWSLPLDMANAFSAYDITIANEVYRLEVMYDLETLVDENSRVVRQASNVNIVSSTFDFDSISCSDCLDYKTQIYVEF